MTQPQPPDGISAFFDEELSPAEREAVADLLSQSAAARNELAEIRRLSEELRQLPRNSAPADLRAQVMNQLATRSPGGVSSPSEVPAVSPWVFRAGKGLAAAAAIGVLISLIPSFWKTSDPLESQTTVAAKTPAAGEQAPLGETFADRGRDVARADKTPQRVELGTEAELLVQQQAPRAFRTPDNSPAPEMDRAKTMMLPVPGPPAQPGIAASGFGNANATGGKAGRKDPQLERILEFVSGHPEEVVIVEVTAENLPETLAALQKSFAQNSVAPANFRLNDSKPSQKAEREPADENSRPGLFVQSSREQLASALDQFREQAAISRIEPNIALAMRTVPIFEEQEPRAGGEGAVRFRRSLAQSVQKYGSAKQGFGGVSPQSPKNPDRAEGKKENTPPANEPEKASPADPNPTDRERKASQMKVEQAKRPQALGAVKSFQMLVRTTAGRWVKNSDGIPEQPPQEVAPNLSKAEFQQPKDQAAQAQKLKEAAPVRLMFVFRKAE